MRRVPLRARVGEAPPDWDTSLPTYSAIPLASNFAAFLGATSIVMALIVRHQQGTGQHIEIPLFHAMFTAIGPAGAYVTEKGLHEPRPIDASRQSPRVAPSLLAPHDESLRGRARPG